MDRLIVWPGQVPLDTDELNTNKNTMIALGMLASACFGTGGVVHGLTVSPTTPAGMTVNVGPGSIYQSANVDSTPYGSLAADTADSIVKQGIQLGTTNFACPAPTTAGQSIVYLIEATLTEVDVNPVLLPFYNANNPQSPYQGPGNNQQASMTLRQCQAAITVKAGTQASTGSQQNPAVDPGYIALAYVTVAYGATSIVAGNIASASSDITAVQFDNSQRMASTAFVQRALGNFQSLNGISSNTSLTSANAGQMLWCQGNGPYTVTLPQMSTVKNGAAIPVHCTAGSGGAVTISAYAGDTITLGVATGNTSFVMGAGDDALLVATGGAWVLCGGSLALKYNTGGVFANGISAAGYQKLPSGLILQWGGSSGSIASGATQVVTLPITFPNAALKIFTSIAGAVTAGPYSTGGTCTNSQATLSVNSTASSAAVNFFAIGW